VYDVFNSLIKLMIIVWRAAPGQGLVAGEAGEPAVQAGIGAGNRRARVEAVFGIRFADKIEMVLI
jgi:hypothetical protein